MRPVEYVASVLKQSNGHPTEALTVTHFSKSKAFEIFMDVAGPRHILWFSRDLRDVPLNCYLCFKRIWAKFYYSWSRCRFQISPICSRRLPEPSIYAPKNVYWQLAILVLCLDYYSSCFNSSTQFFSLPQSVKWLQANHQFNFLASMMAWPFLQLDCLNQFGTALFKRLVRNPYFFPFNLTLIPYLTGSTGKINRTELDDLQARLSALEQFMESHHIGQKTDYREGRTRGRLQLLTSYRISQFKWLFLQQVTWKTEWTRMKQLPARAQLIPSKDKTNILF